MSSAELSAHSVDDVLLEAGVSGMTGDTVCHPVICYSQLIYLTVSQESGTLGPGSQSLGAMGCQPEMLETHTTLVTFPFKEEVKERSPVYEKHNIKIKGGSEMHLIHLNRNATEQVRTCVVRTETTWLCT